MNQPYQIGLFGATRSRGGAVDESIRMLSEGSDMSERGAVFTKRSVVDAILDLAGYTHDRDLARLCLLEPSFGGGAFLVPALERLLRSYGDCGGTHELAAEELSHCIRAVEIHADTYSKTRDKVLSILIDWGMAREQARILCDTWLRLDDFLLADLDGKFDVVVGNPPYVRQERIPAPLLAAYRERYKTIYDRADLYVPFYERCLDLLAENGMLGFICANRWVKNRYGGPLRAKVAKEFHLLYYIDMENVEAFDVEVIAYPAVTVLGRPAKASQLRRTRIAIQPEPSIDSMARLSHAMRTDGSTSDTRVVEVPKVTNGSDPWLLDQPDQLQLIRRLEDTFPSLEDAGCNVGIGVATGVDRVFIGDFDALPVEPSRKLPLVMAPDLIDGQIEWKGRGVVNPFLEDGSLAPLSGFPQFAAFLENNRAEVEGRHVAKKNPTRWYRTIDRIYPSLTFTPKLLIPDIKGTATVVYDKGSYYPHHNLYFVTSETWDLRALQAVLRSSVAVMFIAAYCVRMAGGFLRFQAQYLRRIRVPHWHTIPIDLRSELVSVAESHQQAVIDQPVFRLFALTQAESAMVTMVAEEAQVRPVGKRGH